MPEATRSEHAGRMEGRIWHRTPPPPPPPCSTLYREQGRIYPVIHLNEEAAGEIVIPLLG